MVEKKKDEATKKLADYSREELLEVVKRMDKANKELRAENAELRKFVNYVRSLKTLADFKKLRTIVTQINNQFKAWAKQ